MDTYPASLAQLLLYHKGRNRCIKNDGCIRAEQVAVSAKVAVSAMKAAVGLFHGLGLKIFLECICLRQAQIGKDIGADGIIAKGHEAGGKIGEETSFILLQKFLAHFTLPIWAYGGIGLRTAAACYAAGAEGVVLDSQLLLTKESPIPHEIKSRLSNLDGSETICIGSTLNSTYRVYGKIN